MPEIREPTDEPGESTGLGDERTWRLYAPDLIRYATLLVGPHDATDIVSIAFLRVAGSATEIRDQRRYLMRAVTNTATDQHRSRRRRQARDLHAAIATSVDPRHPDVDVHRAVAALSVQQRAVVYFTYWEDLDANQIGAVLGITSASVRRHLARARLRLRKVLS